MTKKEAVECLILALPPINVSTKVSISFATTNLKEIRRCFHLHLRHHATFIMGCGELCCPGACGFRVTGMLVRKIRAAGIDVFGTYFWPGDVKFLPSGRAVFSVFSVVVVVVVVGCIWSLSYVGYHLLMENR